MPIFDLYPAAGAIDGTELIGPVRQRGRDVTMAVSQLGLGTLSTFASITSLRANTASPVGAQVLGYSAIGDGGEGLFVWNTADTTSADDGGTIIVDAAGHRFYRVTSESADLNVRWFGAKGDGSTDDTAAVTKAVAALTANRHLYFPPGVYGITLTSVAFGITFVLPSKTGARGASKRSTRIKILGGTGLLFGNPLRNTYTATFANPSLGGIPATTPANQTDTDFEICDISFDYTLGQSAGVIACFLLAQRVAISDVYAFGPINNTSNWGGFECVGCDDYAVTQTTLVGCVQAVDCWEGSTAVKIDGCKFTGRLGGGNGGVLNFNGTGVFGEQEFSDDWQVSNTTITINGGIAIFLDSLGGGATSTNHKILGVHIVAATGSGNVGIIGRGAGGGTLIDGVTMAAKSGASFTSPILLSSYYDSTPVSGTSLITTSSGSPNFQATYAGAFTGVGNYLDVNNGSGGAAVINGMSLFGYYPITAKSGNVYTCVGPSNATSSGTPAVSVAMVGFLGCFKNCIVKNVKFDGVVCAGGDLISIAGSGHHIDGVLVTQNYNGSASPQYRSIVSIDPSADNGNATPVPSVIRGVVGAKGTGSLQGGYAGSNFVTWYTFGPPPDVEYLDNTTPSAPIVHRSLPLSDLNVSGSGSTGLAGAWTTFSASVSAAAGTITAASANFRYKKVGQTVIGNLDLTITTNGTGSGWVVAALPFANNATARSYFYGRETSSTGKMLVGQLEPNSNFLEIWFYDGTYPGANGYRLQLEGMFEANA